ncbi:glycosyltransferase [Alloyangia pacifica]|uniref:glycosyltransferase n=1 Tax=Alloyangia pacifica TaxID=311180 RepID=UPI001CD6B8C8|nr:glycosyltransferase [Alloyangia pacifica]MCA0998669.1 glycosyltransferase [Alloyangia pacifica]
MTVPNIKDIYRRAKGYRLNIDSLSDFRMVGWVKKERTNTPISCCIWVDEQKVASHVLCDIYRADLDEAGIGDGLHGFEINLPEPLTEDREYRVKLTDSNSGKMIARKRVRKNKFKAHLDEIKSNTIYGWCLQVGQSRPAEIDIYLGDLLVAEKVICKIGRKDVKEALGESEECGFEVKINTSNFESASYVNIFENRSKKRLLSKPLSQLLSGNAPQKDEQIKEKDPKILRALKSDTSGSKVHQELSLEKMSALDTAAQPIFVRTVNGVKLHGFAFERERRIIVYAEISESKSDRDLTGLKVKIGPTEHDLEFHYLKSEDNLGTAGTTLYRASLPCLFGAGTEDVYFRARGKTFHECQLTLNTKYIGRLEKCDHQGVRGWAIDFSSPTQATKVTIGFNGAPYDQRPPHIPRPDVQNLYPSFPLSGFSCKFDPTELHHNPLIPYAKIGEDGQVLPSRIQPLVNGSTPEHHASQRSFVSSPVTVIVPIYNAVEDVEACIASLLFHTQFSNDGHHLVLANDASPDPRVRTLLDQFSEVPGVTILHQERNLGYTRNINSAMKTVEARDVILLNSDTRVTPQWLSMLQRAAHQRTSIGTVTAVSDNAGAFSVPERNAANPAPPWLSEDEYARAVTQASSLKHPRVPTGSGFCLYISARLIEHIGLFDDENFPRGYGEENDFCMRAMQAGWENVFAENVLIYHERSKSFLGEKAPLMDTANKLIPDMYPEYPKAVGLAFASNPHMKAIRHGISYARLRGSSLSLPRVVYVIGVESGGTPQTNMDLMSNIQGDYEPWLLLCSTSKLRLFRIRGSQREEVESISLHTPVEPISHDSPAYRDAVSDILQRYFFELVHIRHIGRHGLSLISTAKSLEIPIIFSIHDFYTICPNVKLLDAENRYCGGKCTDGGSDCNVELWRNETVPVLKRNWVRSWKSRFQNVLKSCDCLITTSPSAKKLMKQHYDLEALPFHVIPHARDFSIMDRLGSAPKGREPLRIFVPGHLVPAKGLDLVREIKALDSYDEIEFHFAGMSRDDLSQYGVVHGRYERDKLNELIRKIRPHIGAVFSIWPETYSHTVTEMWAAGLPVVTSNLGATGERIAQHGGGWALDDMSATAVFDYLRQIARDPYEINARCADVARWQDGYGQNYNIKVMAERYKRVYRQTIDARKSAPAPVDVMMVRRGLKEHEASAGTSYLRDVLTPEIGPHNISVWPESALHVFEHLTPPDVLLIRYHGRSKFSESLYRPLVDSDHTKLILEISPDCSPSAWQSDNFDPELAWLLEKASKVIAPKHFAGEPQEELDISEAFASGEALENYLKRQITQGATSPAPLVNVEITPDQVHASRLDKEVLPGSSEYIARHNSHLVAANSSLINWSAMLSASRVRGRVSIVVPIYNKVGITQQMVESVTANTDANTDYEVILLDNGSQIEVYQQLKNIARAHPRVKLVRSEAPLMFSVGCNYGASFATGEYIIFANNDIVVKSKDWLEQLLQPLKMDPTIGITGARLLYEDGTVQHAGISFNEQSAFPYHVYKGHRGDAPYVMHSREVPAVTGACMMMRATDWAKLRGFSPIYVNGSEDVDLCLRMNRILGLSVYYVAEPKILHLEGKSPGRGTRNVHNRFAFVSLWKDEIAANDRQIYVEDSQPMPKWAPNDLELRDIYRSLKAE